MISRAETHAMKKALKLAACGRGSAFPNPMVGAVILDRNGNYAGDGFHRKCGAPHAEVIAIASAGEASSGGTMVVTLEPCCHHGRTGPCTDEIIRAGISRIVVAMTDPDPRVSGRGIEQLESAGIEVETGLFSGEARTLNRVYLHYLETSRSWVTLKIALSLDGRTAAADGSSRWISCDKSRRRVHRMRASVRAVLTGAGTVRADDPELTVRLADTLPGRQPVRIVVSSTGDFGESWKFFRNPGRVIIAVPEGVAACLTEYTSIPGVDVWEFPTDSGIRGISLASLFERTAAEGIGSILCEAGSGLSTRLLKDELVDSVSIFTAPVIFGGEGRPAFELLGIDNIENAIRLENVSSRRSGSDFLTEGCVVYRSD
ncbi:MAG: bifunctional diaminohydroxyphosphoribosylaminopyrimidine deaminase/5-amino-6-(5-phosphoribosylamino)uracil reductase RibD [Candidatus Aegiribacteria sp.]|nr:bifunctional diaminohydroxyphosphoribosylaminopyrimidine deaminase/5-amino-6-(5-phosphoribosylamino)uracil reductase RibD [Candidatus Aegiribacteria sp.]